MTITEQPSSAKYTFTTCKRCGYIINTDEELCQKCQVQQNNNSYSLFDE